MNKIFLVFSIFTFLTVFKIEEKEVFICMSKSSKTFHLKKDCKGIKKCKSKIKKVTKKKQKTWVEYFVR